MPVLLRVDSCYFFHFILLFCKWVLQRLREEVNFSHRIVVFPPDPERLRCRGLPGVHLHRKAHSLQSVPILRNLPYSSFPDFLSLIFKSCHSKSLTILIYKEPDSITSKTSERWLNIKLRVQQALVGRDWWVGWNADFFIPGPCHRPMIDPKREAQTSGGGQGLPPSVGQSFMGLPECERAQATLKDTLPPVHELVHPTFS